MFPSFKASILAFIIIMFNLSRQSSGFRFLHTSKSILIQRNQVLHAKRLEIGQTIKLRLSGTIRSGTIISKPKRGEWNVAITNSDGQISNQVLKKSDILSSELVSPNVNPVVASRSTSIEDSTADTISISSTVDSIYVSNPSKETTISYTIPPDAHAKCSRWIIFSDLHVKGSSMETCEEVLREVHKVALHKDAGIIFLGDFWHVRGSLSVELLNRVLRSLRMWTQPVIMIPGNHDQVSLGGAVHALEPLRYAFRPDQILMISEPTVCLGALWIPYRRNAAVMKSVLTAVTGRNDVSMIFCHADVKGAFMNDNIQSQEGLEASDFPSGVPTYTGHFHKPHTILKRESKVCYVGSPYQTSLSEAGQQKYLYCMTSLSKLSSSSTSTKDTTSAAQGEQCNEKYIRVWREEERMPIHIGKKFFKISMGDLSILDKVNEGDKVVLQVRIGEEQAAEKVFVDLKALQVEVELRHEGYRRQSAGKPAPSLQSTNAVDSNTGEAETDMNLIDPADGIDPLTVFRKFMTSGGYDEYLEAAIERPAATQTSALTSETELSSRTALYTKVFDEGISTLSRLQNAANATGAAIDTRVRNLSLEYVKLSDFGPYGGKEVTYPLGKRGIVLLTADSSDGTGADSNGAGKTTLVMSVLWGLTGSMDARLAGDSKATDVAFDAGENSPKRTAEVTVVGSINGQPFELVRRRGPRKTDLVFSVNGTDLTKQSVKDTQDVVDELLGVGNNLLQRCCFFGQHSHTLQSLLGLSDLKLKSELAMLVDTQIWAAALQDVRTRERVTRSRTQELGIERRLRLEEIQRAVIAQMQLQQAKEKIAADYAAAVEVALKEAGNAKEALSAAFGPLTIDDIQTKLRSVNADITRQSASLEPLRKIVMQFASECAVKMKVIDVEIVRTKEQLARLRATAAMSRASTNSSSIKLKIVTDQITHLVQSTDAQLASATNAYGKPVNDANLPTLLEEISQDIQELRSQVSMIDISLVTAKASLARIKELTSIPTPTITGPQPIIRRWIPAKQRLKPVPVSVSEPEPCVVHDSLGCPTCGSPLPIEKRMQREAEITREIDTQTLARRDIISRLDLKKTLLDTLTQVRESRMTLKPLMDRQREIQTELAGFEASLEVSVAELAVVEKTFQNITQSKETLEATLKQQEAQQLSDLSAQENILKAMQANEVRLRQDIEKMQRMEQGFLSRQSSANATVVLQRDRLRTANATLQSKNESIVALETSVKLNEQESHTLSGQSLVLNRLGEVVGTRGIQQYLFISVIRQIEEIANGFLNVLADSGIQLSLQGEWDSEKIIKKVLVRATDGELRERGLAQLSGGQWRRVSLSLDLAFSEVVRRRGTLRCGLIVMDEILTHLDASGREAVGSVLRGLVESVEDITPRGSSKKPSSRGADTSSDTKIIDNADESKVIATHASDSTTVDEAIEPNTRVLSKAMNAGAYDTVLVILQDLSALEMEEAFDHVDIVIKKGDTASVTIDGELIP